MTGCGHTRHVGTCAYCQRAQLARWHAQLLAASIDAQVSTVPTRPSHLVWKVANSVTPEAPAILTSFSSGVCAESSK
jgi:hypothetical protein